MVETTLMLRGGTRVGVVRGCGLHCEVVGCGWPATSPSHLALAPRVGVSAGGVSMVGVRCGGGAPTTPDLHTYLR